MRPRLRRAVMLIGVSITIPNESGLDTAGAMNLDSTMLPSADLTSCGPSPLSVRYFVTLLAIHRKMYGIECNAAVKLACGMQCGDDVIEYGAVRCSVSSAMQLPVRPVEYNKTINIAFRNMSAKRER